MSKDQTKDLYDFMYNIINDSRSLFCLGLQTVLSSHKLIQRSTLFDINIGFSSHYYCGVILFLCIFHLDITLAENTTSFDKIKGKEKELNKVRICYPL